MSGGDFRQSAAAISKKVAMTASQTAAGDLAGGRQLQVRFLFFMAVAGPRFYLRK
jgi:hypothetical protein